MDHGKYKVYNPNVHSVNHFYYPKIFCSFCLYSFPLSLLAFSDISAFSGCMQF